MEAPLVVEPEMGWRVSIKVEEDEKIIKLLSSSSSSLDVNDVMLSYCGLVYPCVGGWNERERETEIP